MIKSLPLGTFICVALYLAGLPLISAAEGKTEVDDDFNTGVLSKIWNPCQMEPKLTGFEPSARFPDPPFKAFEAFEGKYSFVLVADNDLENRKCFQLNDPMNDLGQSTLVSPDIPYGYQPDADSIKQRNEIRLKKRHRHGLTKKHYYGFNFKMTGAVPKTGSMRWVIGQWKHTTVADQGEQSPFLAQRYDNGIFHISVQDGHCRCRVAKAKGNPDLYSQLNAEPPLKCIYTSNDDKDGQLCESTIEVEYGKDPILPNPYKKWTEVVYRVRGGRDGEAEIRICVDKKFIAKVTGPIGYPGSNREDVKFKIGRYRNYIKDSLDSSELHIDKFWISKNRPNDYENCFPEE